MKTDLKIPHKSATAELARSVGTGPPPIIVLSPSLGPRKGLQALKKELAKVGYVAIIAEPAQVKIMEIIAVAPMAAIARAALQAIRSDTGYVIRPAFANAVCDILAPREPTK